MNGQSFTLYQTVSSVKVPFNESLTGQMENFKIFFFHLATGNYKIYKGDVKLFLSSISSDDKSVTIV